MEFTLWHAVDADTVDLNLAEYSPVKITSFSHQDRDNVVRNSKYFFNGTEGAFEAQRVIGAWFNVQAENAVKRKEALFSFAQSGSTKIEIDKSSVTKINHRTKKSVGYYAYGNIVGYPKECIIALGGYRLKQSTYDNDMGEVDTIISFLYCDSAVRSKDFNKMLSRVDLRS